MENGGEIKKMKSGNRGRLRHGFRQRILQSQTLESAVLSARMRRSHTLTERASCSVSTQLRQLMNSHSGKRLLDFAISRSGRIPV